MIETVSPRLARDRTERSLPKEAAPITDIDSKEFRHAKEAVRDGINRERTDTALARRSDCCTIKSLPHMTGHLTDKEEAIVLDP